MAAIKATPANGYQVVSTFSGCGGTCLGFRMAGFTTVYASEFVAAARDTYQANHGIAPDPRDIREVIGASVRQLAGLGPDEEIDVMEGSPPCASFSMSGSRDKHWGEVRKYSDTKQRTDDLFGEFARLLGELRPKVFVAENVAGLLRGVAKGYYKEIHDLLAAQGYVVRAKLLDAQWLGVPQARQRVILMGVRADLGVEPIFPTPLTYRYSIREALPWLSSVRQGNQGNFAKKGKLRPLDQPLPVMLASQPAQFSGVHGGVTTISYRGAKGFKRMPVSLSRPAPTIQAEASEIVASRKGAGLGYEVKEGSGVGHVPDAEVLHDGAVVTRPRSRSPRQKLNLDAPAPTMLASAVGGEQATMNGQIAQRFAVFDPATDSILSEERARGQAAQKGGRDGRVRPLGPNQVVDPETGHKISFDDRALGAEWSKLQPGHNSDVYPNLNKPDPDRPSPVITATGGHGPGTAAVTHPTQPRKFTIAELRRLCSFPDDFVLTGTYKQQWERMGRAVPPMMAYYIALAVRATLDRIAETR